MNSHKIFEQLYFRIDQFFSAEWDKNPVKKSGNDIMKGGRDHLYLEWDLNQKYSDIAARDLAFFINKLTPLFVRKFIVIIHQFVLFYFLTDQEFDVPHQSVNNKQNIYHSFNRCFYRVIHPFSIKTLNKERFSRFYTSLERTFRNLCCFLRYIRNAVSLELGRNNLSSLDALDLNILSKKTTFHDFPKIISGRLFHKRI